MNEKKIVTIERKTIGIGTIVTLKSGGPPMTVTERTGDKAHCSWHIENGDLISAWIYTQVLEIR